MNRIPILTLLLPLLLGATLAAAESPAVDEEAELAALLDTLDELTEIATRNRMNSDYVPGMVSVLRGERLEAQGIHTVWEALDTVTGLESVRNNFGEQLVLVRGVGHALHSGNLKVMLNSIPMNNDLDGQSQGVFAIPVSQVERIEVYRGPGSALYGEYAYAGVVNVITRKEGNRIAMRVAGHDTRGLSGRLSWESPSKALRLFGNLSGWESDGSRLTVDADGFTGSGFGFAPGPIDDRGGNRALILGAAYEGFTLLAQSARMEHGAGHGLFSLPPSDPLAIGVKSQRNLSLDKRWTLAPELELSTRLYRAEHASEAPVLMVVPPGYGSRIPPGAPPPPPGAPVPLAPLEGLSNLKHADMERHGVETELSWRGWEGHQWLLGVDYAESEVSDALYLENGQPVVGWAPGSRSLPVGVSRELLSVTVQDQWMVTDTLELTGGLRYDDYSDVGESVTPRVAAVWRIDDRHLLKAQYAEAFRPPTLGELWEGSGALQRRLKPELLDSLELSYILRLEASRYQVTLFQSDLKDLIEEQPGPRRFRNTGGLRQRGIELEWERPLGERWRFGGNLAYTDSEEIIMGHAAQASARWLGNLTLSGRLAPGWSLDARLRHVADRAGWPRLGNDPLEDYTVVSVGVSGLDFGAKGLTVRAGVDNLFDEPVEYLAAVNSYSDNLLQPGRGVWLQLSYDLP